jgi:PPK2 family polyphosphate:nucleotide phosphotransferase
MRYRDTLIIKHGDRLMLKGVDPAGKRQHESEPAAKDEIEHYRSQLAKLQSLLYAEKKRSVLIVLQAMDAGGKDGVVNHVLNALNPQGARVNGFQQPTKEEAAHDFLWRIHRHTPARGEIAIFNRSHYEDVLVPRVHKMIDKPAWEARYLRIRDFEEGLADNGTLILKFFLHISKEEQLTRFAQRLDDPHHNWKISESDYSERVYWDAYMTAYEDAISATSSKHAPWFVIPANHKWFRNLVVSQIIVDAMEELDMSYPKPTLDLSDIRRRYHTEVDYQKSRDEKRNSR